MHLHLAAAHLVADPLAADTHRVSPRWRWSVRALLGVRTPSCGRHLPAVMVIHRESPVITKNHKHRVILYLRLAPHSLARRRRLPHPHRVQLPATIARTLEGSGGLPASALCATPARSGSPSIHSPNRSAPDADTLLFLPFYQRGLLRHSPHSSAPGAQDHVCPPPCGRRYRCVAAHVSGVARVLAWS